MKQFNLIFLRSAKLLLSFKKYNSWKDIQNQYEDYMASVDFDNLENIIDYIVTDYKLERKYVELIINNYTESKEEVIELKF